MGLFGDKGKGLVSDKWLYENGVSSRYSNIFKKSNGWVKKECKRVEQNIVSRRNNLAELETKLRSLNLEKDKLASKESAMKKRADWKTNQELQEVNLKKRAAAGEIKRVTAVVINETGLIRNFEFTSMMLNWIIEGTVKTAEELHERANMDPGEVIEDLDDRLVPDDDVDNSFMMGDDEDDSEETSGNDIDPGV
jgi:hypothetical protein